MTSSRWVVVNDNDGGIKYAGSWLKQQGNSLDKMGSFGTPYRGDWHKVNENASFSYAFDGTRVIVEGSTNVQNISGILDPTSTCSVDGVKVGSPDLYPYQENNWALCDVRDLPSGKHVITLNVTSAGHSFYLDRIRYIPTTNLEKPSTNQSLQIGYSDSRIDYDSNWRDFGDSMGKLTSQIGATMTFSFFGTSLSSFAINPSNLPRLPARGNYSINDEPPTTFEISSTSTGSTRFNQLLFQSPTRPLCNHTLKVTYTSGTGVAPLVMSAFIVHNDVVGSSDTHPLGHSTSTKTPIGPIVGGAVGGMLFLLGAIFFVWYCLYLRRRSSKFLFGEQAQPFLPQVTPNAHPPPVTQVERPSGKATSTQLTNVPIAPVSMSGKRLPMDAPRHHLNSSPYLSISNPSGSTSQSQTSIQISSSLETPPRCIVHHRHHSDTLLYPPGSTNPSQTGVQTSSLQDGSSRIIHHHDSGYRLQDGVVVVEHPPIYSQT